jgi:transposase
LIRMQTRLVNQLTACLKAYYPVALELFAKVQQKSTMLFLQTYPTPQTAMAASAEQIKEVLRRAKHSNPTPVATTIFERLHQPHLQADAVTTRTKSRLMVALVSQLLPLVGQITAYDKEITRLFRNHPDSETFRSLPGAAKRLAPRLLAGWGDDRTRYRDAASMQALAGTSPVPYESGNYAKVHKRYACIKSLRNALHQFAWESTRQEAWALDYYRRKRKEGKSHSMAVRALANVWVRIIFAMWLKYESYASATFLAARHAHGKLAA